MTARIDFRTGLSLAAIGGLWAAGSGAIAAEAPNVVLVLVDDLGWADTACYGSKYYETPNIDKLCSQGMKFTQGYASCAVCSPTRASIQTGRYPARIGITDWIRPGPIERKAAKLGHLLDGYEENKGKKMKTPYNGAFLPHEEITIAEQLKKIGYATCYIGKWHLGGKNWLPEDQGFDINIGGCHFGSPGSYYDPYPKKQFYPRTTITARKTGEYLTDREAEEAVKFIREHKDHPFFLQLSHYAVHAPIMPKKSLLQKYNDKEITTKQRCPEYATMVESVDQAFGKVMQTLDELKLTDNTLVIFTSDNGGASHVRCHGVPATDNSPLRDGKGFAYEGGIREPFIFRWPGHIKPGTVSDDLICSVDLLPTICTATGAEIPKDRVIDGINILPTLTGKGKVGKRTLYWHFPHYWWGGRIRPYSIVRDGNWKLIRRYETGKLELYNLADDLSEKNDLAQQHPEICQRLNTKLDSWLKACNAKMPILKKTDKK
jgi:arylsulfatase A-like enzyme